MLTLFTPRTRTQDPATWTPTGTTVVQRYRNTLGEREGAIVLVYTAAGDRGTSRYAAVCLGCTFRVSKTVAHNPMTEKDAAKAANAHATSCRAMNRGVPAMPDDDQAAQIVRARLWAKRTHGTSPHHVHLSDFHEDRVDLQRDDHFIKQVMFDIARTERDFLTAQPASGKRGTGTCFLVHPHPARS